MLEPAQPTQTLDIWDAEGVEGNVQVLELKEVLRQQRHPAPLVDDGRLEVEPREPAHYAEESADGAHDRHRVLRGLVDSSDYGGKLAKFLVGAKNNLAYS